MDKGFLSHSVRLIQKPGCQHAQGTTAGGEGAREDLHLDES